MIPLSRVTYLSKLRVFRRTLHSAGSSYIESQAKGRLEFFYVGGPHEHPVTPTGTIGISVSKQALFKNSESFAWAFFGDSGAFFSGRRAELTHDEVRESRLSFEMLREILDAIDLLSPARKTRVLQGYPDLDFLASIGRHLHPKLLAATSNSMESLDWRLEIAFNPDIFLQLEDILHIAMPNTYRHAQNLGSLLKYVDPQKLIYYNPRFETPHGCINAKLFGS